MKKYLAYVAAGLAALALLVWVFTPDPAVVELATVTQGRFERAVVEDGKTRVRDRYIVSAPLAGRVARVHLKQGDQVERGAPVATFWPIASPLLDARTRAEQSAHSQAMQSAVARAQANMARAAAAVEQARIELRRSESLAAQGYVSPTQNETGRLNVKLREQELEAARQEVDAARHELEQSRIALRQFSAPVNERQQGAYEVKAPISGKVLKLVQQSEGIVPAGTPLLELGDPTRIEVVVDILTEDAAQIQPGTQVQLSNWGRPAILTGLVRLIEPAAFTKVSALGVEEQRVNAIIDITSAPEQWKSLGDGFKIDVRLLVQVVENAIKVPVSALFPVGSRSGLFVLTDGRAGLKEVDVAARNGVDAWIRTGVEPGARVIVYPDTKLKDKDRVKSR